MKYTIRTELDDERELTSSNDIEWAVRRLADEEGSFFVIEPESAINSIAYLQAAYIQKTKGLFKKTIVASYYFVEVQEQKPNGDLYQYSYETEDINAVLGIARDFFEIQKNPVLTEWQSELFYKAD